MDTPQSWPSSIFRRKPWTLDCSFKKGSEQSHIKTISQTNLQDPSTLSGRKVKKQQKGKWRG